MTWTTLQRSEGVAGLSCHVAGSGSPVVLIHGVGLRSEAWGALIPHLAPQYRVIAVDLPGHGESVGMHPNENALQLNDYTDRFAAFLRPFGQPVAVVGHSMGAMIALDLAVRFPELVSSVAALNAIFQRDDVARTAVQVRAAALGNDQPADPSAPLDRWFGQSPCGTIAQARDACEEWLLKCDPAGYATAYRVFANHDGPDPDDLVRLVCPALFMTGADEPNSTPAMSQAMADLAPQGSAYIIKGAAHMAPMTHPVQIAGPLLAFLGQRALA